MSKVVHYEGENVVDSLLATAVLEKGVTVVDFFATWCGPCRALGPVLDELSMEVEYRIVKVDVDKYPDLATFYGVRSIPTLVIFKDGKPVDTLIGGRSKEQLNEDVEKATK
ncbi:thioredoxin [Sneathia vaginalis]|uniref:thioredoxin n=1 Tax=Sneathia vaginalis TaxID=187101 RepID=UPI00370D10EB